MNPQLKKALAHVGWAAGSIVLVIGVWAAIIPIFNIQPYLVPTPQAAFSAIGHNWSAIWPASLLTIRETAWGFVAGAVIGFSLAVVMFLVPVLRRLILPVVIATQAVPIIAIAPILVILLGFNLLPKVVVVTLFVFFPVTISTLDGLVKVDPDLISLSKVLGASRAKTFWFIEVPAASSSIFTGLKLGGTYAVAGAIIGEQAASTGSSLYAIQRDAGTFNNVALVYGTTVVMTVIGLAWFLLVVLVADFATPWNHRTTARRRLRGRTAPDVVVNGEEQPE